jgi:hypothetical protein
MRYQAGIVLPGYNALKVTNAPTIGTATAGNAQASVTFTAPACIGGGAISSYTVFSNCGAKLTSGASSPLVVTGLTNGTSYTFKAIATNAFGPSFPSAASNSATPVAPVTGQQAYTTAGTYSWVAPTGVTSVAAVAIGPGREKNGGGLGWKNNISVTPGNSYSVVVGAANSTTNSYFVSCATVQGDSGLTRGHTGDGGGNGGLEGYGSGGGAGGYSGNGGAGVGSPNPGNGVAGSGGAGGSGAWRTLPGCCQRIGGGGGGVCIYGQGSNGAGGTYTATVVYGGGGGSGGEAGGFSDTTTQGVGGAYGGGAGHNGFIGTYVGAKGAVRIIWPGATRSFPSTNTGDL